MRAEVLVMDLKQNNMEPAAQGMVGICTLLSCALGPREGVSAAQTVTEEQVMAAITHRHCLEVSNDTLTQLTDFLNSDYAAWLYFSILDLLFWPKGACKQYHKPEMCITDGNIHLGDSGMLFHGRTKKNVFDVILADLGFQFPGIEVIIEGGARPKEWSAGMMKRDELLFKSGSLNLHNRPIFGQTLTRQRFDRLRRFKDPLSQLERDLTYSIEYVKASGTFEYIPRVPADRPEGPRIIPARIELPDVSPPLYEPVGQHWPQFDRVSVANAGMALSEGFTPFVSSRDQQYAYVESFDSGDPAAVDLTPKAPPVKAPATHARYARPHTGGADARRSKPGKAANVQPADLLLRLGRWQWISEMGRYQKGTNICASDPRTNDNGSTHRW